MSTAWKKIWLLGIIHIRKCHVHVLRWVLFHDLKLECIFYMVNKNIPKVILTQKSRGIKMHEFGCWYYLRICYLNLNSGVQIESYYYDYFGNK